MSTKPSRDQWLALERELTFPLGQARLMVDGYDIKLKVEREKALKYSIAIYVNGYIKGMWMNGDCEEGRRFMCELKRRRYSEKQRKLFHLIDRLTKRQIAKNKADGTGRFATYSIHIPYFNSFRALKAKLVKNNKNIEVVEIGYGQ